MHTKLIFILLLLPVIANAQDSLQMSVKADAVKERFRAITGPDANYTDSMAVLRRKLNSEIVLNLALSDSIADLNEQLLLLEKKLLVSLYGAGQLKPYTEQQYRDFSENGFLQHYFANEPGTQVFFGFNDVTANLGLYSELTDLAEKWKREKRSRIVISASSDAVGDEKTNVELARQRAEWVKQYLVGMLGVDEAYIDIVPAMTQKVPEAELDFLNRRAVVRIVH